MWGPPRGAPALFTQTDKEKVPRKWESQCGPLLTSGECPEGDREATLAYVHSLHVCTAASMDTSVPGGSRQDTFTRGHLAEVIITAATKLSARVSEELSLGGVLCVRPSHSRTYSVIVVKA